VEDYTKAQYWQDLEDASFPHLESRERFKAFYYHLGQNATFVKRPSRMIGIEPKKAGTVVELGCHAGYNLVYWATKDPELTLIGVDISTPLLNEAASRLSAANINSDRYELIETFIEDITPENMPIPGPYSDLVLTDTLEHVQYVHPVLQATINLMTEETVLWITVPTKLWGNSSHVRGITKEELAAAVSDATDKDMEFTSLNEDRNGLTRATVRLKR
jgi:trans-aconitate methyltransferase